MPCSGRLGQVANKVVLGHYPEYTRIAAEMGAYVFQVQDYDFDSLTPSKTWAINRHFLDRMYYSGADFLLATPVEEARVGSWFEREIKYLNSLGSPMFGAYH